MEEKVRTRTQLFLGTAAIGLLLTGAAAQTTRDEQPRAGGQSRSEQSQRQQVERIQDTNRQKAEPQNTQPQTVGEAQSRGNNTQPATSNAQPPQQQQGQNQNQQGPRTVYPTQTGQKQPAQQPTQGNAQNNQQSGAQPSQSQAQPSGAATNPQPPGQAGNAPSQQPAQSQPQQTAPPQQANQPTAQRPAQPTSQNAQRGSSGVVSLNVQQQTQVGQTIARANVKPLTNVSFSISVGTRVPASVQLRALPADLVTFVPQYRGYSYFVVEEQVVIVEPASHEIVTIIPYTGSKATTSRRDGTAAMANRPVKLNTEQREVVRKHATERRAAASTTVRKRYELGDRIDREVTVESFPETVYTEVPSIRRYRYFRDDDDVLLVDPDEDRVVDVIR